MKNWLLPCYQGTDAWFDEERSHGRFVDKTDLYNDFMGRVDKLLVLLYAREAKGEPLSRPDKKQKHIAEACKEGSMPGDANAQLKDFVKYRTKTLVNYIGCRLLKPQRLMSLTPEEEQRRFEATLRFNDKRIWSVAFGDEQCLSDLGIGRPAEFIKHRKHCVFLASDQVPSYCKAKATHQLYDSWEVRKTMKKGDEVTDEHNQGTRSGGHNKASVIAESDAFWDGSNVDEGDKTEGMTQKRGDDHKGADKFRITVELVHAVYHWFDPSQRPRGKLEKAIVVLCAEYADDANIDNNHRFIETKYFEVGGKPHVHQAGEYTALMYNLIEFRKSNPEVFDEFRKVMYMMQQPSGFFVVVVAVDAIVTMSSN